MEYEYSPTLDKAVENLPRVWANEVSYHAIADANAIPSIVGSTTQIDDGEGYPPKW